MGLFGLYIHWPFCKSRCPYCDYNAHVRDRVDVAAFGRAMIADMRYWGERTAHKRGLTSIFFGGGTPSLMPPQLVYDLIAQAQKIWGFADQIEITLEANPTSSEAAHFKELATAGVNRLSMGIQSLDDRDLKFLGRSHTAAEAEAAISIARDHFARYSFDLIYARPDQTVAAWDNELGRAMQLMRDHISLYQLSVENQTAFATSFARGDFALPDQDAAAALYDHTLTKLAAAGFSAYEVSSFARNNDMCRHNLCYWRYYDYIGVGCGAHGRITMPDGQKIAARNVKMPEAWQTAVESRGNGCESQEIIDPKTIATEMILMNMRLAEGLNARRLAAETGNDISAYTDAAAMEKFLRAGFMEWQGDYLRATPIGRNCLNELLSRVIL